MSVRTDTVNLIVNVNGNSAQNNLNNLRKKANEISFEMKGLVKGTAEYIAKGKELGTINKEMDAIKKTIGLTALSQRELVAELKKLNALKGSVTPFSNEYKDLAKNIKEVEKRLFDVKNGTQGFSSYLGKLSFDIKQFGVVALAAMGGQFIKQQFDIMIKGAAKLSDQLADLRRVSGLTADEAENLNNKLNGLNTRTSAEGLREIAIIAGKLGVAKEDIFGFTESVDKLVVTLGDELGNADQITTQLGKILNVFDGKVTGENILKLGNAFIELANTGAATGGFIADFDQRLSGIAKSSGISLGALSGLGAGLEELGGRVESSSTAIQNLIISISDNTSKAAKIAGLSVKEFNKLFANDPTEALLKYSEGLVKNKTSFAAVTASLKDAGEEGARTIETITKLGTSGDYLRGRIDLSEKSIQKSTASTEAFALKNETFGATLEKLGKEFNKLVTESRMTEFLKGLVQGFSSLINPAKSLTDQFREQAQTVRKLESETLPLINRYDELKKKSTLNKDEQVELKRAITAIGNTIPGAITQFDAYGRALGINTSKAREFINLQKTILKEKNRDAIKDQQDSLNVLQRDAEVLQRTLNSGKIQETVSGGTGGIGTDIIRNLTDAEIKKSQATLAAYQERIAGIKGIIDELKGDNLKLPDPVKNTVIDIGGGTGTIVNEEEKKAAAARKKQSETDFNQLKKEAKQFQEDLLKLKQRAQLKGEEPEQAEIDAVKNKYAELTEKARIYYNKQAIDANQFYADKKLFEEAKLQELNAIFDKYYKKRLEENSSNEYDASLTARAEFSNELKAAAAKDFADNKTTKKQYDEEVKQIDRNETADRITIAQDYSGTVKKAAKDHTNFRKQQEKETTQGIIDETQKRKVATEADDLAKAKRAVLTSRPGSSNQLAAKKALLKLEMDQEIANSDLTNEQLLLRQAEYNDAIAQLDAENKKRKIQQVIQYVQAFENALGSVNDIINARENKELARDKANNDKKKKQYKDQLDKKLISKEQYDKKVQAADEEMDRKNKELRQKQAKREKALNLFQAVINTASAVAEALPSVALSIIAGVLGAIQIAAIAATPIPELGKGEWIREGDKHSDKSGGINAKIERDEAVISAAAMTSDKQYTVTGNTAQITSALNSQAGGVNWAGGAVLQMPRWRTERPATLNPNMPRIMEQGGIIRGLDKSGIPLTNNEELAALAEIKNIMLSILETTKDKNEKLHAVVSIKEFDKQRALYDQAKKVSGVA